VIALSSSNYYPVDNMLPPLKEHLAYRLVLAGVAGCLAAWVYLPEGFFQGPHDILGWYLPGTVFGLLVLLPLLKDPVRHWFRSAILLCAATVAHLAMWTTGFSMFYVLDGLQLVESDTGLTVVLGGSSGLVFGVIVALATTRTLDIRFVWYNWIAVALLSGLGGSIFAGIIMNQWEFLRDILHISVISRFDVYVAYMILYLVYAMVFTIGKQQPLAKPKRVDMVLLGGLVLLTPLCVALLSVVDMR